MRRKKALKNIIVAMLLQVIVVVYGFVVPRIIITNFGSEVNGLISSISQFLGYITLLESGFGPVIRTTLYKPIANKNREKIASILRASESFFKKIAILFVIYVFALVFFYPMLVATEFDTFFTISLIIIISLSVFSEYFFGMTYKLFLESKQDGYIVSLMQMMSYIISIALIVIVTKAGASVQIIKLVGGLAFIIRPILQNYYVKKKYNIQLNKSVKKFKIEQKWDGLSQHIASVIHSSTDIIVLTVFSSLANVSIYSVYAIVTKGLKSLIQPLSNSIESTFGDMIAKKEKGNLTNKFNCYETVYDLLVTVCFTLAMILITPFVIVYTLGVTDANYNQPLFGIILVVGEFIWAIRQPYNNLIKAAGHFRETRRGAWVECILNIVISIVLVVRFGLIGVAIGTAISMFVRTAEFVYHVNKYILNRSIFESVKKIILIVIEVTIIMFISNYLPYLDNSGYLNWVINAIMVSVAVVSIVMIMNLLFYRNDLKSFSVLIKSIFKKGEGGE